MKKPAKDEYNQFLKTYIDLVPEGDLAAMMYENLEEITLFFKALPLAIENFKYAPEKWSVKELLAHINDSERVFAYRALVCIRMDDTIIIPNMDENLYAKNRDVSKISLNELINEFRTLRESTIHLFKGISEINYNFRAKSDGGDITAKALGFAIIGHTLHHRNIINERYIQDNPIHQ